MENLSDTLEKVNLNKKTKTSTLFWGIELDNDIFQNELIKLHLESNPQLKKQDKLHSTLLFVGKKSEFIEDEEKYFQYLEKGNRGKKCKLLIDAYGYSEKAMALRVKEIKISNENGEFIDNILSDAVQQHITLALKNGTPPKDSVKTLQKEEGSNIVMLDNVLELFGHVKRW